MKKLIFTAITVIAMVVASYAGNGYNTTFSSNDDTKSMEKGKPHTQEYKDYKKVLDAYEEDVKAAQNCGDLEDAISALWYNVLLTIQDEYPEGEQLTEEENDLLSEQGARIEELFNQKKERWGCDFGEEMEINDDEEAEDIEINADVESNELILEYVPEEIEDDEYNYEYEVFQIVEEMPEFPGGNQKMMEFLAQNLKYPQTARETGIQGKVFVNFVVEPDGSISNVKVLRGIGGGCDDEAIRVIKSMPKWKPGKQRGKAVRVSYNLPVNFKLTDPE